jgi:hypothetical protein
MGIGSGRLGYVIEIRRDGVGELAYLYQFSHTANGVIRQNIWAGFGVKFLLALGVPIGSWHHNRGRRRRYGNEIRRDWDRDAPLSYQSRTARTIVDTNLPMKLPISSHQYVLKLLDTICCDY